MEPLDFLLLNTDAPLDDENLSYQRIVGNLSSDIICFLPWRASFPIARKVGIIPEHFLACYQLPNAIVSSEPHLCTLALELIASDALNLLWQLGRPAKNTVMAGFSMGSGPATVIANRTGARLCSITSADRGDLMLWESPAAQAVKSKALDKHYKLKDFTVALSGYHPIENLKGVRKDSIFVTAEKDMYVPQSRTAALLNAVDETLPAAKVIRSSRGHIHTIVAAAQGLDQLLAA